MKGLSDIAGRLAWMDKQGIDRQVIGGWPDWFGNDCRRPKARPGAQLINEALLAAAKAEPRFVPLATCRCRTAPAPPRCSRRDGGGLSAAP